jgi:hypothetical protein
VSELQGHGKSSIWRQGLAIKMHNVLRLPSTRADQRKRRKQEHGKEITEEGHEARSHQAVDDGNRPSLKVKSGCKFLSNETNWTHQNWRKQEHGKEITEEGKKARSHQAVVGCCWPSLKVKSGCKKFMNETGRASALPVFFVPPTGDPRSTFCESRQGFILSAFAYIAPDPRNLRSCG